MIALSDPAGHVFQRHPVGDLVLSPLPLIQFFLDVSLLQGGQLLEQFVGSLLLLTADGLLAFMTSSRSWRMSSSAAAICRSSIPARARSYGPVFMISLERIGTGLDQDDQQGDQEHGPEDAGFMGREVGKRLVPFQKTHVRGDLRFVFPLADFRRGVRLPDQAVLVGDLLLQLL